MTQSYKLRFEKPAVLDLELVDKDDNIVTKQIDLLKAYEEISKADKSPDKDAMWDRLGKYLAQQLGISHTSLTLNVISEFRETVIAHSTEVIETVKKKLSKTASSPTSTLESEETGTSGPTASGQSGSNDAG